MAPIEWLRPNESFKHWIASDLRFFREREGLSLSQMGQIMGCNRHTVSNIEHARDGWNMNRDQARQLDTRLQLNAHFERLVHYARTSHNRNWFADYSKQEAKALVIRIYRLSLIPGLLQTPAYARALLTVSRSPVDIDAAVEARMKRQEILTRKSPPAIWVLLDESVLHHQVGGPDIMREQLSRLLEVSELPHVTVRIIPHSTGAYLGLDGSFTILTTPTGELAFVEALGGGRLIQESDELREFTVGWESIGACALPWQPSRDLITQAMEQLS